MEGNERKVECKKKKLCCKFVGGLCSVPARKNGITLIALIITVIVMLILVGVTINVALNGELFTQAQTAAEETQIEADKEQLLSAVVGAIGIDAKVNFSELDENLPKDWTKVEDKTYQSPKGNVYTVDSDGNIKDANKTEETTPGTGEGNGGTIPGTGDETENNSEKYSFKLNDLGDWVTGDDSIIYFDEGKLWEVIGEDLSTNEQYIVQIDDEIYFNLSSDNNKFISFLELEFGKIEASQENIYSVTFVLANFEDTVGKVGFFLFDASGKDIWRNSSVEDRQAFLDEYGDVVFKIEDNSSLK